MLISGALRPWSKGLVFFEHLSNGQYSSQNISIDNAFRFYKYLWSQLYGKEEARVKEGLHNDVRLATDYTDYQIFLSFWEMIFSIVTSLV